MIFYRLVSGKTFFPSSFPRFKSGHRMDDNTASMSLSNRCGGMLPARITNRRCSPTGSSLKTKSQTVDRPFSRPLTKMQWYRS
jgi:hypothetical protein